MADCEEDKSRDRERNRRLDRSDCLNNQIRERSQERNDRYKRVTDKRIYVSNIPYDYRWQDLKDLFRTEVGRVAHVELFTDESDKPRGCGIVEFEDADSVRVAVEKMHRFDIKGRKLVVKEDYDVERDQYGRFASGRSIEKSSEDRPRDQSRTRQNTLASDASSAMYGGSSVSDSKFGNTYGLSSHFLDSLGINGPLVTRIFVANLDYKVDEKKLSEVFKLAGRVLHVELGKDKEGKSRGFGVVEYDHPVEAVQAISMLHNQQLYDRRMIVRLDRANESDTPLKLPEGLKGIGVGLGANGNRLRDVARNIPNLQQNVPAVNALSTSLLASGPFGTGLSNIVPAQLAALNSTNAAALQATLATGLGASLATSSLLNSSLTNDLASNLGSFQGVANLANLQASLSQPHPTFNSRSFTKLDDEVAFANSSTFVNPSLSNSRDLNNVLIKNHVDRLPINVVAFSSNVEQIRTRQTSNGSRVSDTILIGNLPPNTSWQMLRDKCQDVGEVKFAEMRGADIGMVRFASEWDAERAVSVLNRSRIDGRTIEVRLY